MGKRRMARSGLFAESRALSGKHGKSFYRILCLLLGLICLCSAACGAQDGAADGQESGKQAESQVAESQTEESQTAENRTAESQAAEKQIAESQTAESQEMESRVMESLFRDGSIYKISSVKSGRVLEARDFGNLNGSFAQIGTYDGSLNQLWKIEFQGDGTYRFVNMATLRCLAVKKDSEEDLAVVCVENREDRDGQLWTASETEGSAVQICSRISGKPIGVMKGGVFEGMQVLLNADPEGETQDWKIELVDDSGRELPRLLQLEGDLFHSSTPEIVRYGDTYYCYIMAPGVSIKTSADLCSWKRLSTAFPLPNDGELPFGWMSQEVPGGSIWAPGVYAFGGKYYLYYCISTVGSQNSVIGFAVNKTLDHTSPDFGWEDQGVLLRSHTGDPYNCIDPNVFVDEEGEPWLVFGSYWGGVYMGKLDRESGRLLDSPENFVNLARRPQSLNSAVEAPYLIQKDGYYYLFTAFNQMDITYHNVVTRSESLTGPFVDRDGKAALEGGGTPTTESKEGLPKPGHCSVFCDEDGQYYMVGEYLPDGAPSMLFISTIVWQDGWPVTALTPGIFQP